MCGNRLVCRTNGTGPGLRVTFFLMLLKTIFRAVAIGFPILDEGKKKKEGDRFERETTETSRVLNTGGEGMFVFETGGSAV